MGSVRTVMRPGYFSIMQKFSWAFKPGQLLDVLIGESWSINKKGATGAGTLQSDALWSQTARAPAAAGIGSKSTDELRAGVGLDTCDVEDFGELRGRVSSEWHAVGQTLWADYSTQDIKVEERRCCMRHTSLGNIRINAGWHWGYVHISFKQSATITQAPHDACIMQLSWERSERIWMKVSLMV